LTAAGMELSWLYAWASFLTSSALHRPFPLPEAVGTFGLAAAVTLFSQGRGWRVMTVLGLQVMGFSLAGMGILHDFHGGSFPFWSPQWVTAYFGSAWEALEWLVFLLLSFLAVLFWIGGATLARRPTAYLRVCSRFDLGVAAFFLLLLVKFLLLVRGGIRIYDPLSHVLVFPFFAFSLLAIGLVRGRGHGQKDFLPGYRGIGVILSFTVLVFLFGTGLVLLLFPYLTLAAEIGYGVVKSAAEPLAPVLVSILRFLFLPRHIRQEIVSVPKETSDLDGVSSTDGSWWAEIFEKVVFWAGAGLLALAVVVICGLALWWLIRWLFSRTGAGKKEREGRHLINSWAKRILAFFLSCLSRISGMQRLKRARELYGSLLVWGRHSGLPRMISETPLEYGFRLKQQFPALEREIGLIIEAFNLEVYAERVLEEKTLKMLRVAWSTLRSPSNWPSRIRVWFLQSGKESV